MVCVCGLDRETECALFPPTQQNEALLFFSKISENLYSTKSPPDPHRSPRGASEGGRLEGLTPRFCILGGFIPWESLSWERVERGGSWEVRVKWVGEGRSLAEVMEAQVLQGTQCLNSAQCPRTSAPEATLPCRHDGYLCCKKF